MKIDVGDYVQFDGEKFFVDSTDEEVLDDGEELSCFILPIRYADDDEYEKLWRSPEFNRTGLWVPVSELNKIDIEKEIV